MSSTNRAYTVSELDALRNACERRWLYGTTIHRNGGMSRQYQGAEKDKAVEELVRTHMMAGHVAKDLEDADIESQRQWLGGALARGG